MVLNAPCYFTRPSITTHLLIVELSSNVEDILRKVDVLCKRQAPCEALNIFLQWDRGLPHLKYMSAPSISTIMFRSTMIRSMFLLAAAFVTIPLSAQTKTDHYIVELTDAPAADFFKARPRGARPAVAELAQRREAVRQGQRTTRSGVEREGAIVDDSVQVVANALIVRVPADKVEALSKLPGVKRVFKARQFKPLLDHAAVVHAVDQVWAQIGVDRAGAGIKIGIIDTGIDNGHPGFQSPSLQVPAGFPKTGVDTDSVFTNNKVIVARSYVRLLGSQDTDYSARDRMGHGTATAMSAAGVKSTGPLGTISGMAPAAFIGNYKIFGTPTYNDYANDAAILKALDDAVADGMDIISMSVGSLLASRLADDAEVAAVERASSLGVLVVLSAGNGSADREVFSPNSISSPGTAPSAITVGASMNERDFSSTAKLSDGSQFAAIDSATSPTSGDVTGQLVDVSQFDSDGLACTALPSGKLSGKIAFILRGNCTFDTKLTNAQQAGAIGALVYTHQLSPDAIHMGTQAANLGSQMVSYTDGMKIKAALAADPNLNITLSFPVGPIPVDPYRIALFSSRGPNVDSGIKPDLLAVGSTVYTATQSYDVDGEMYDPSGYGIYDGTSFSAPILAGAAAVLKSARPGLTAAQYRSLLINSATPLASSPSVQSSGVGELNLVRAIGSTVAVTPVSLSFGAGTDIVKSTRSLTLSNVGTTGDNYTITVRPRADGPAPVVDIDTLSIAAGSTAQLNVSFAAAGLAPGAYEGLISIQSASSGSVANVPYWYAVGSDTPAYITILDYLTTSPRTNSLQQEAILFRVTDASGIPLPNIKPTASCTSGGGSVIGVNNYNSDVPGLFSIDLRMGRTRATDNVIEIQAGDVTYSVTITTN